jgi:hypothetical protein
LPLALLDTPCSDTANRSANSVREPLKPLVERVGDVVRRDVQVRLGGVESGKRYAKGM